jgi:hypothetical protein
VVASEEGPVSDTWQPEWDGLLWVLLALAALVVVISS